MEEHRKNHWENIYETKNPDQVSWTQNIPSTSLALIRSLNLDKSAKIIDVGGGDSTLVDFLLEEGFENISVLDISAKALEKARKRIGNKADQIHWIVADVLDFQPDSAYDLWHDRAAFHFLIHKNQITDYTNLVKKHVSGYLIMGTFSDQGPLKCSGLDIHQYNENTLKALFEPEFELLQALQEDHITPFQTSQNFQFGSFKKKEFHWDK